MSEADLIQILARGEDSHHQFKRDATNADGLAAELVALANSGGGKVLLGVADDGSVRVNVPFHGTKGIHSPHARIVEFI